jgi:Zn-dependent metalloprotease
MKDPGTAYDDPNLGGRDSQPADMDHYVRTSDDNGGVHTNSGIPNRAFYLTAIEIGGNAWEKAGAIWYKTLTNGLTSDSNFQECASITLQWARQLFGQGSKEEKAVSDAWSTVKVTAKPITVQNAFIRKTPQTIFG